MILEDFLQRDAARWPDKTALVCGDLRLSYAGLWARVCRRAAAMPVKGTPVILRATASADFLIDYFAAHVAGCVAVPVDKDLPDGLLHELIARLHGVSVPEGTADVLFTTGTTGQSKGVVISHRALVADAENLAEAQRFTHTLTYIVCGPMCHIGSLSKVYPTLLAGATLCLVDGLRDAGALFRAIDTADAKAATFLVPASLRMLMRFSRQRLADAAPKIDFIETGAAPMAQSDMEELCRLLPATRLYNTYASTETGIVATFDYNAGECVAGCLGRPMRHSRIHIRPDGRVACQGDTLMTGYLGDEALTQSVLSGGVLVTSDLGRIDGQGRLHLTGRDGDVINTGGYKVSPIEVESAALSMEEVKDCICIPARHPVAGDVLKLLVVADGRLDPRRLAAHLRVRLEPHKVPMLYEQVESVRRTFNGKLDRKAYRTSEKKDT